jgi:hypothetical protein
LLAPDRGTRNWGRWRRTSHQIRQPPGLTKHNRGRPHDTTEPVIGIVGAVSVSEAWPLPRPCGPAASAWASSVRRSQGCGRSASAGPSHLSVTSSRFDQQTQGICADRRVHGGCRRISDKRTWHARRRRPSLGARARIGCLAISSHIDGTVRRDRAACLSKISTWHSVAGHGR